MAVTISEEMSVTRLTAPSAKTFVPIAASLRRDIAPSPPVLCPRRPMVERYTRFALLRPGGAPVGGHPPGSVTHRRWESLPDGDDRRLARRVVDAGQPVGGFDGAQDGVVVDAFAVAAG